MAFERLRGDVLNVLSPFAQELFGSRRNRDVIAFDFDLGDAIDPDRHTFAGVDFRRLHVDREEFKGKQVHFFNDWHDEGAAALDDPEAPLHYRAVLGGDSVFAPGDDQHLVGADLGITAGPDEEEDEDDDHNRHD